ncbi:MAG: NepR family anti-sigma factor [Sphingomicrobium sp.]
MSGNKQSEPGKGERTNDDESRDERQVPARPAKKKAAGRPADVGRALRSVYDDTLREDIPSDLKDLLGRLG